MRYTGQAMGDTEWRGKVNGHWRATEQAAVRRGWVKVMERDKVHDRGCKASVLGEAEPGCSLLCLVTLITLY